MTKLALQKLVKRLTTGAAVATLGSTIGLGLVPGFGTSIARAESVSCSSEWAEQAIRYLRDRLGYEPPFTSCYEIDKGETETAYITFNENDLKMSKTHAFVGECDDDCGDLDLRVYDEDGDFVGEDTTPNSYAEVYVGEVAVGETFRVDIIMYDCSTSYCGAVLGKTPRQ